MQDSGVASWTAFACSWFHSVAFTIITNWLAEHFCMCKLWAVLLKAPCFFSSLSVSFLSHLHHSPYLLPPSRQQKHLSFSQPTSFSEEWMFQIGMPGLGQHQWIVHLNTSPTLPPAMGCGWSSAPGKRDLGSAPASETSTVVSPQ